MFYSLLDIASTIIVSKSAKEVITEAEVVETKEKKEEHKLIEEKKNETKKKNIKKTTKKTANKEGKDDKSK